MRATDLIPVFLILGLAGCQLQELDATDGELGMTQQASIGGLPANGEAFYEATAAITILLPLANEQTDPATTPRTEFLYCSGVLIEDRTVMTAAGCLKRNLEFEENPDRPEEYLDSVSVKVQFGSSASVGTEFYLDATVNAAPNTTKGLTMHRYYTGSKGLNDVALLRLSESPGITPVEINAEALDQSFVSMPLTLVGYGRNEDLGDKLTFTARNVVTPPITEVSETRVKAGTVDQTTCFADQGGPGFLTFEGVPKVATVSVTHDRVDCLPDPIRQRVDVYASDFILPYVKFFSGQCDGGACDDCEYNGVCKEDCPTRDWDCELGAFTGEACNADGDCEEQGHCVPASDDETFTYCSKPCNADDQNACPTGLSCESGECVYVGISPGSQGFPCTTPDACRSGYCENSFCASECDAQDPNACDAANDFFCLPSSSDGTPVCRKDVRTGGGGFCAISPASSRDSHRNGFLALIGMVFLGGLFRRRRLE